MRYKHRIVLNIRSEMAIELRDIGFTYDKYLKVLKKTYETGSNIIAFDIYEDSEYWPLIKSLLDKYQKLTLDTTEFTRKELENAPYLEFNSCWHNGYPQPDWDFAYKAITYASYDYCKKCGMGLKQVSPFRLSRAPKWGRRHVFCLNWVEDEYFVHPETWKKVFKPFGVGCRKVVYHRSGKVIENVVQLKVNKIADCDLDVTGLKYTICPECERKKYIPITRGGYPNLTGSPKFNMFRLREHFGYDPSSYWPAVISQKLYRAIIEHKLKGVVFTPLGLTAE